MAKRRFVRRKRRQGGGYTVAGSIGHLAKRAMQGVKFLKSVVNVEHKYHDLAVVTTNLDSGGVAGNFHTIAQGNTAITRNGDLIKVKSLEIGVTLYKGSTQSDAQPFRLLIIKGNAENGVSPTGALVYSSSGTYQVLNSPRFPDQIKNYKIIKEIRGVIGATNDGDSAKHYEMFIPIDDHVHYSAGGSTTVEDGGLYYLFFCGGAAGTSVPNFTMYSRTRFIDN